MRNIHINLIYGALLLATGGVSHYVNPWLGVLLILGAFIWAVEAKRGVKSSLVKWSLPLAVITLGILPFFIGKSEVKEIQTQKGD